MGLNLNPLGKKITDFLGGAVDRALPGDQSFLHRAPTPAPQVQRPITPAYTPPPIFNVQNKTITGVPQQSITVSPQVKTATPVANLLGYSPKDIQKPIIKPAPGAVTNNANFPGQVGATLSALGEMRDNLPWVDKEKEALLGQNPYGKDPKTGKLVIVNKPAYDAQMQYNSDLGANSAAGTSKFANNISSAVAKKIAKTSKADEIIAALGDKAKSLSDVFINVLKNMTDHKEIKTAVNNEINKAPVVPAGITHEQAVAERAAKEARYNQSAASKAVNATKQELYDPRAVQQKLDNEEFARQKAAGQTLPGQTELLPDQSLAVQRGHIENAGKAAEVRSTTKYTVNGRQHSVNSIIKHYGPEAGQKARDFENYRIYKDELEKIQMGSKNSLGVDPAEMDNFVKQYEAKNPLAIEHNAVLRQNSLDALKVRRDLGIDTPEVYDIASQRQFYNPRGQVQPDGLIRPQMNGTIRSGEKGTMLRSETSGGPTKSPLGIFHDVNTDLERTVAQHKYNTELARRTKAGNIKGAEIVVDPQVTIRHKALLQSVQDLSNLIKEAKGARKSVRSARTEAKSGAKTATRSAKDTEKAIVAKMKDILKKAKTDANNIFHDVVSDDPRRTQAIKDAHKEYDALIKKTEGPLKARVANKLDAVLREIDKKYPKAQELTHKQLLELAYSVDRSNAKLGELTGKAKVSKKLAGDLGKEADNLKTQLEAARAHVDNLQSEKSGTYSDYLATTQQVDSGKQLHQFVENGETGKIELPADLADELSKADRARNSSPTEQVLHGVAAAQKITWTGMLQPAFMIWNAAVKNPILAYRNADGLSGIRPEAVFSLVRQVFNTPKIAQFKTEMLKRGVSYQNALKTQNVYTSTADDIAARANLISFFKRNPASTLQDVWKGMSTAFSAVDNAQRTAVAYGAYKRAKGLGWSEKEALDYASQAPAKVFGDFDRISRLAQNMEIIIPYTGATQAGTRALIRATKTKPFQTTFKDATIVGTMAAFTAYSLMNNKEYYDDMKAQNKEYLFDNNWTIVLPGAHKDEQGNWSGIIHVPMLPDIRPLNRAAWRSVDKIANGEGIDPKMVASEVFNTFTGDISNSVYDPKRVNAENNNNYMNGIFTGSPALNMGKTLAGVDTRTGKPLADEYTATLPRTEQFTKSTSQGAKDASVATGGLLTPQQFDQIYNQIGMSGDLMQKKDGGAGKAVVDSFTKPFKPGTSQTELQKQSAQQSKDLSAAMTGATKQEKDAWNTLHPRSKDGKGNTVYEADSTYNPVSRLDIYNRFPKTLQIDRETDTMGRLQGKPHNPLYDLTDAQIKKVLEKDALLPGAKDPELSKLYQQDWYATYAAQKTKYFSDVKKSIQKELAQAQLEKDTTKIDSLTQSSNKLNDPANPYPETPPALQKAMDAYSALPSGTGAKSAWIRSNPEAWAAMQAQFAKIDNWQNIQRGKRGLDATEGAAGIANGYGTTSKYGSGGGSSSLDPMKYAISLKTGYNKPKGTVNVKSSGTLVSRKTTPKKPKVAIKKSRV